MRINFSDYYYTKKLIPNFTDPTLLKVIKITAIIFIGPFIFLMDCTSKLLANRNVVWKKEQTSSCSTQSVKEKILNEKKTFEELHSQKYMIFFENQKKILESVLDKFNICTKGCIEAEFREFFDVNSSPIHKILVEVVEILLKQHSIKEVRNEYTKYNHAIRKALATDEYLSNKDSKFAQIIQELCFGKFVGTNLTDWEEEFIFQRVIPTKSSQEMTAENISQWILDGNEALKNAPRAARKPFYKLYLNNALNAAGIQSDQLIGSNIAELRSKHTVKYNADDSELHTVYYIRYPTPTIESGLSALAARVQGNNTTIVAPEYVGFLEALRRKKTPFLYVNHQYMDRENEESKLLSADNNRAEAIQKLENNHDETFHFLSLPLDGPIIEKIGENDLEQWKEGLLDAIKQEKNGFRLPKRFKESLLNKIEGLELITKLLNELHRLYFLGEADLSEKNRRVLLLIFYSYLKEYFKAEYRIGVMASVCKDNKDRGGVSACIDEAIINLRLGREDDQQALHDLYLRALAPFMIKYQEIVGSRLRLLIDVLDHIAILSKEQKTNIRKFKVRDYYEIVEQYVPRS